MAGLLFLCLFMRCCCRRSSTPVVDVAEIDPRFDDDDDDYDEDDEFEEIEIEENGRGCMNANRKEEKATLHLGPSSTGEHNGSRRGSSSRAHRVAL